MELRLREIKDEDSRVFFKWINNKKLVNFNSNYKPISQKDHENWFYKIQNQNDSIYFTITLYSNNKGEKIIGSTSLRKIDYINKKAQFQIRIGEIDEHNKGWGTLTVQKMVEFAFLDLNLNRIELEVFETNSQAKRVYEKCGFKIEGIKEQDIYINGKYVNVILMAILKNSDN